MAKLIPIIGLAATGFFSMLEVYNKRVEVVNVEVLNNQTFLLETQYNTAMIKLLLEIRQGNHPQPNFSPKANDAETWISMYNQSVDKQFEKWSQVLGSPNDFLELSATDIGTIFLWFLSFGAALIVAIKE